MPIVLTQYNYSERWSGVNALESVDKLWPIRYVSNNSPVVPEPAGETCVQKCVKSTRQFVRYDTNPNNDFKSRKRYEVDGKTSAQAQHRVSR